MPIPNYSFVLSAQLLGSTTVAVGDVLIPNTAGTYFQVSTTGNRGTRGSEGIALSAYGGSTVGSVQMQQSGVIDASISGLSAGSKQLVRVSSAGRIERISSYTAGDDVIGYAEADGRVHLHFGLPWGDILAIAGVPGGSVKDLQYHGTGSVFGAVGEWTRESSGRLNVTTTGYLTYGAVGDTYPAAGLIRVDTTNQRKLIVAQYAGGTYDVLAHTGARTTIGDTFPDDAGVTISGGLSGTIQLGQGSVPILLNWSSSRPSDTYAQVMVNNNMYLGHRDGSSGGISDGRGYLALGERIVETTATPINDVFISLKDPSSGGVEFFFPSGNKCVVPDANGTAITTGDASITFAATSISATGNARARTYSSIGNVNTTDATVTTVQSWTIIDEAGTLVSSSCIACRSTGAEVNGYKRTASPKRDGGSVTFGTVEATYTREDAASCDYTLDNSSSTGRTRWTGEVGKTFDVGDVLDRLEVTHA